MSEAKSLALVKSDAAPLGVSGGVKIDGMADVFRVAEALSKARGFVPDTYYQQPQAIAACILTGMELGIPPMTAMREIHVIKGRPSISATLMLTLAQRAGVRTRWLETTTTKATIGVTLPGQAEQTLTYTADDAKAAGLWGQGNWSKFPANMLRARATSNAIRAFCPSVIGGSVYESESGELTDGKPTADVVEAQVIDAPQARPAAAPKLTETQNAHELRLWCESNAARIAKASAKSRDEARIAIGVAAERIGCSTRDALVAAGLERPAPAPAYDPETGEVPPDQEPAT